MLLPAFAAAGDQREDAVVTVLVDHVWIRERMDRLALGELDLAGVHELEQAALWRDAAPVSAFFFFFF